MSAEDTLPTIRPATSADLPRLGELGTLLVDAHHAFDARRFFPAKAGTPAGYAAFLARELEQPDNAVFVAEENGQVIGYAFAAVEGYDYKALRGPAGVLHDILVEPGHRGRGAGRLLLDAALAFFKERGAPQVVLWTADRNEGAQRLFASAGFRRTMIEMTLELDETGTIEP